MKRALVEIKSTERITDEDIRSLIILGKDVSNSEAFCLSRDPTAKKSALSFACRGRRVLSNWGCRDCNARDDANAFSKVRRTPGELLSIILSFGRGLRRAKCNGRGCHYGVFDRKSDDVRTLTGKGPLHVQDFVRKNAVTFTTSSKAA